MSFQAYLDTIEDETHSSPVTRGCPRQEARRAADQRDRRDRLAER
jgi:hypothetical protein